VLVGREASYGGNSTKAVERENIVVKRPSALMDLLRIVVSAKRIAAKIALQYSYVNAYMA
jgi:hypothetical protein